MGNEAPPGWTTNERARISLMPLLGRLLYGLGRLCEHFKKYELAWRFHGLAARHSGGGQPHYRLGLWYQRSTQWRAAADHLHRAIQADPSHPHWYLELGFILQQLGDYRSAAEISGQGAVMLLAYGQHAHFYPTEHPSFVELDHSICHYIHGLFLEQMNRGMDAVDAYRRAIMLNSKVADWHHRLGQVLERAECWDEAATAYTAALARNEEHESDWYYRLGRVLTQAGRADEALEVFRWSRVLAQPSDVQPDSADAEDASRITAEYIEYFTHLPLLEKAILYESHQGTALGCNPYAIFKYLLDHPDYADWTHVWVLNDKGRLPAHLRGRADVITVRHDCDIYRRYLASAKYLINNAAFPGYFMRRLGQWYLNTWHGTPLKTLGKDISSPFFEHENGTRNFLHATHLISPNPHTTGVLMGRYDIKHLYTGIVAETGYPRIDLTVNVTEQSREALRHQFGLERARPVILYAPTWRGALGKLEIDIERLVSDIQAFSTADAVVLFRGHHMVENRLVDALPGVHVVPPSVDTNELLSIVDVLVTDYSSIAVDFLATGRPVVHYLYDYEDYRRERGLYFDKDELPGYVCHSSGEVCVVVDRLLREGEAELSAAYIRARDTLCPYEDGGATKRVVDLFFGGKRDHVLASAPQREAVLFFAGQFVPNGITSAFLNLIHGLDRRRYLPVVISERDGIIASASHMERFARLGDDVAVLGRCGSMNLMPDELRAIRDFETVGKFWNQNMVELCQAAYRREFYRLFGTTRFSAMVNFEGYAPHWVSLFAFADRELAARSVIYLHNDMRNEWLNRFPYLGGVMSLYPYHDRLVSVGRGIWTENRQNLSGSLGIAKEAFVFCDNPIDISGIRELAAQPLDAATAGFMPSGGACFLTMGRLSPEKDHAKLIRAVARLRPEFPDICLLILGQGPLEQELAALIAALGLDGVVHLLGQRANPYPALNAADCFVLSSNYEGQPMVLLEALALGKPVIATDIPGARNILSDGYGLLVENSEDGLADGLRQFLEGQWTARPFDAEEYQAKAMQMFYRIVDSDTD